MFWKRRTNQSSSSRRSNLRTRRSVQAIDALEPRLLLTANMTDQEQLLLELVNRARANPAAEAARFGIPLNQGLAAGTISTQAKQPLAPHQALVTAARLHSDDMLDRDYFSHTTLGTTNGAGERALSAGYPVDTVGENIAWGGTTGTLDQNQAVYDRHESLFRSPGHRENMMNPPYEEVGMGVKYGQYRHTDNVNYNAAMVTENFGIRGLSPYITGVVYTDSNTNSFYDIGESMRAGTVTATNISTGAIYTDTIGSSGAYGVIVPAGNYNVTAQYLVNGVTRYSTRQVTVGTDNVKVDFDTLNQSNVSLTATAALNTINELGAVTSTTVTVTRNGSTSFAITVNLSSNDTSELTVPASITIPAGQTSAQFTVNSVNDTVIDGTQIVQINATANGYSSAISTISVTDNNAPSFTSVTQVVTTARPTFTWTGVSNAATYEIWINNATTGASKVVNVTGITTTSYTPTIDLGIGTYNVWVRGFTSGGLASLWSNSGVWQTRPIPTVTGSGRTEPSKAFTIAWSNVPGASSYDVWVDRLTSRTSQYLRNTNVTTNSLAVDNFAIGKYGVWVRARNSRGDLTQWSNQGIINVSYGPDNLQANAISFLTTATISWGAVGGATAYDVWVDNLTTNTTQFVRNTNVAATTLSLPSLTVGSYRAWIRAKDVNGVSYAWSTPLSFEFQKAVRVLGPPASPSVPRPQFSWTAVAGAQSYELVIADTSLTPLQTHSNLTDVYFTPDTDLAAGSYRAWITAFDGSGNSFVGPVFSFAVAAAEPAADEQSPDEALALAWIEIEELSRSEDGKEVDTTTRLRDDAHADARELFIAESAVNRQPETSSERVEQPDMREEFSESIDELIQFIVDERLLLS